MPITPQARQPQPTLALLLNLIKASKIALAAAKTIARVVLATTKPATAAAAMIATLPIATVRRCWQR